MAILRISTISSILFLTLVFLTTIITVQGFKCPPPDSIYPCDCYTTGNVGCYFKDNITQKSVDNLFVKLREVNDISPNEVFHFPPETGDFSLRGSNIIELDLTPFVNVSIERIFFADNGDLTKIKGPDLSINQGLISVKWLSLLDYGIDDIGLGETLKYFDPETLIRLHLLQNNLKGATSGEILPGFWNFKNLEDIDFGYNPIKKITSGQFAVFSKLSRIHFGPYFGDDHTLILEKDAFKLHQEYNNKNKGNSLSVTFENRNFNESHFNIKELGLLNYPDVSISLDLSSNKFERISQENFEAFLLNNAKNMLDISSNPLNCEDRGSLKWLVEPREKYESRVSNVRCNSAPWGCTIFQLSPPTHICRLELPSLRAKLHTLLTIVALSVG